MSTTGTTSEVDIDQPAAEAFAERLFELYMGPTLTCLIDIGRRTALFDAAAKGPATSHELAKRAGLHERYVREWLGAMTTAGVFEYDASTERFWLPREHAASLSGPGPENLTGVALLATVPASHFRRSPRRSARVGAFHTTRSSPRFTRCSTRCGVPSSPTCSSPPTCLSRRR